MNIFHLFDLDYTLWKSDSKLAVINKNKPEEVIYRIESMYIPMMKTYWRKHDLPVRYNGTLYWLDDLTWKDIQKNTNISIEDIGISNREWTDKETLDKEIDKVEYLLKNISHLKDWNIEIGLITSRTNKSNHTELLKDLKEKIYRKIRKNISKIFFINDLNDIKNEDSISNRKAKIVLEHLTGHKIRRNKFIKLTQTRYNSVHFYDDNKKNIETIKNLQFLLEECLRNTDTEEIKKEILNRIENNDLEYITHHITCNEIEAFITSENKLLYPNNL